MDNPNLWHLRDHIFGFLNHKTVVNCRKVCKFWNESLERTSYVKFLQEFGDRKVRYTVESRFSKRKYSKESRFSKDFGASHFITVME